MTKSSENPPQVTENMCCFIGIPDVASVSAFHNVPFKI